MWADLLPWQLSLLPDQASRVRMLRCLLWAMPERAQHFGLLLAARLDAVMWHRLARALPEVIPRRAGRGWMRYY